MAWVEYTADGRYTIVAKSVEGIEPRTPMPYGSEIHGMAWDNITKSLYVIITDDDGMYISRVTKGGTEQVTYPTYSTLSGLKW